MTDYINVSQGTVLLNADNPRFPELAGETLFSKQCDTIEVWTRGTGNLIIHYVEMPIDSGDRTILVDPVAKAAYLKLTFNREFTVWFEIDLSVATNELEVSFKIS